MPPMLSRSPSILAYPFRSLHGGRPDLQSGTPAAWPGGELRHWWRVALAAESAGAAQAAVALYAQSCETTSCSSVIRLPAFQSVQHRLVQCHMVATALYYLALRAAWSGEAYDADVAACYAQQHVKKTGRRPASVHRRHGRDQRVLRFTCGPIDCAPCRPKPAAWLNRRSMWLRHRWKSEEPRRRCLDFRWFESR